MRVALLSNGPSLRAAWAARKGRFDVTIGVNRAVSVFPCDYWAAGDWQCLVPGHEAYTVPIGKPKLYTMDSSNDHLAQHHPQALDNLGLVLRWWEVGIPLVPPDGWSTYTSPAALVLATHLGATVVEAFGVDMAGTSDCRGIENGAGRDLGRWMAERTIWDSCVQWLQSRGCRVIRHVVINREEMLA